MTPETVIRLSTTDRKLLERIARALEKANGITYRMDVPAYRDVELESDEQEQK